MSDWLVRVYDKDNKVIDVWVIEDGTEAEALAEAESEVDRLFPFNAADDWTMTGVNWKDGCQLKVVYNVEVWVELHPDAEEDNAQRVLTSEIPIDVDDIEERIAETLSSYYSSVSISRPEQEAFSDWLADKGETEISAIDISY